MKLQSDHYLSPRWSWEIGDCGMPMSFDTYSNCAHQCLYCFAYFQRAIGGAAQDYLAHKVKSVDVEKVKRLFRLDPTLKGSTRQFMWYVQRRYAMQWGGLSDGFDWYEKKFGKSLELLRFFREINYPISISTKGTWFLEEPAYQEAFAGATNVHVKYSIITADASAAKVVEAGCSSPADRFAALKRMKALGIAGTTFRFRPFIIGLSDHTMDELFEQAADAGCDTVSTEFLCLEKRATPNHLERYRRISEVAGMDLWKFYRQHSYSGSGLMRLNYDVKRPFVRRMQALAAKYGLGFYVSDAHHKEQSAGPCCCGIPTDWRCQTGQFAQALQIAKATGRVAWSDIALLADGLKEIPYANAEGYNQGDTRNRAINRYHSMFDYLHELWNNTRSWSSPARYFGGVLVPGDVDAQGDVVYLYNVPFVEDGFQVQSVAELQAVLAVRYPEPTHA